MFNVLQWFSIVLVWTSVMKPVCAQTYSNPSSPQTNATPADTPKPEDGLHEKLSIPPIRNISASIHSSALKVVDNEESSKPADVSASYFPKPLVIDLIESPSEVEFHAPRDPNPFPDRPLYFEDVNLERYGNQHAILQPLISAGKFAGSIITLPYQLIAKPIASRRYDTYPYPAGTKAPRFHREIHIDSKAGIAQAAATVGLILIIP